MVVAASSTASSPSSVPSQAAWCAIFQCWSGKSWKLWKREKIALFGLKNIERRRLTHYSLVLFVPLFVRFLLVQLFSWVQNCAQYILFACTMVTCVMLPLAATSQLVVSSLCLVLGELLPRSVVVTWVRAVLMIGEGEPGHDIGCRLSLAISLNISFHSNFCLTQVHFSLILVNFLTRQKCAVFIY